jgi:hypothetical protein
VKAEAIIVEADTRGSSIQSVFDYWRQRTGKLRARLLPERAKKISARLTQFSEAELKAAIDGALLSEFHRGDNNSGTEYLDIRTLFKNGETVEGHIARAGGVPEPAPDDPRKRAIAELKAKVAKALRSGHTNEYNRLNAELADALKETRCD